MFTIVQRTIVNIFIDMAPPACFEHRHFRSGEGGNASHNGMGSLLMTGIITDMAMIEGYRCIRCGARYGNDIRFDSRGCPGCKDIAPANLQPVYCAGGSSTVPVGVRADLENTLWRYASSLPCLEGGVVSLGEGLTPLMSAERIGKALDVPHLFIKDESRNPTWSHKDRFSTVAVSAALSHGAKVVATASSGNAGASLAAYAAKAGLGCVVTTFAGAAGAMISQIQAYGASIVPMARKSHRWEFLRKAADQYGWYVTSPYQHPVVGSHPLGIEGYKTMAYEIFDQSGGNLPEWCVLPVCYGDALAGIAAGFCELLETGKAARVPRLVAAEVHGSLSSALEKGVDKLDEQVAACDTVAVSIGTTRSTYQALKAIRDSRGCAVCVTNDQLIRMQGTLARKEGMFAELASVAPLVAVQHLRERGEIKRDDRVVAIMTASGLKDLDVLSEPRNRRDTFHSVDDAWKWIGESTGAGREPFPAHRPF